jgi:hypothetical protein
LLDRRKHEFSSIQKLSLSCQYGFPAGWHPDGSPPVELNWISEAVTNLLLYHNPNDFTTQDIHDIGDKDFLVVFKGIIALERECCLIGLNPPNMENVASALGCTASKHVKCKRTWVKMWRKHFLPCVLHPVEPTPFATIQSFVRMTLLTLETDISNLCAFDFSTEIMCSIRINKDMPSYPTNIHAIIQLVTMSITTWYQQL